MKKDIVIRTIIAADFVDPIESNDFLSEALETLKLYGIWLTNLTIIGFIIYGLVLVVVSKKNQSQSMNDSGQAWIFRAIGLGVVEVIAVLLLSMFGI